MTHAEYVKAASAACTDAAGATAKVAVPVDLPGLATYARTVEGIGQRLSSRLGELRPPAADAKKHGALHAATEEATHAAGQLADAAGRKDRTAISAAGDQLAKTNVGVLAAQAGLPACSTAVGLPGD